MKIKTKWTIGEYDPRVIFDEDGLEVACVHRHYDEAIPMARLMAAAPELLEMCQDILVYLNDRLEHGEPMAFSQIESALRENLADAIARAEGIE